MVGKAPAGHVADVQLDARGLCLCVRRVGHRVGPARAVTQHKFHVLPRVVAEGIGRGQLQLQLHHVGRAALQRAHAHGQLFDGEGAFVGDLARFEHHRRLCHAAAGQHPACGFFVGAQGLVLVCAVHHGALQHLALARATGAVLAAVGQAHAGADGGGQDGFARLGFKAAAAGLHGDGVGQGGGGRCGGHVLVILAGSNTAMPWIVPAVFTPFARRADGWRGAPLRALA
jgi:hypothetical protein